MEKRKSDEVEVEFFGLPSGDYEGICFDVPKEIFIELMGKHPDRFDKSYFNKKTYRVYIQDLIRFPYNEQCIIKVNIKIEQLKKKIVL